MERSIGEIVGAVPGPEVPEQEIPMEEGYQEGNQGGGLLEILKTPTGPGSHKDPVYLDHPFNFNGSLAVARIIRGATGIVGEMSLAIVDILFGTFELIWGGGQSGEGMS